MDAYSFIPLMIGIMANYIELCFISDKLFDIMSILREMKERDRDG